MLCNIGVSGAQISFTLKYIILLNIQSGPTNLANCEIVKEKWLSSQKGGTISCINSL